MYYSSGNYEAFARPVKPEGVDHKSAYLIGTGLAALSAACYLVRDAQMPGSHIHIFEKDPIPGGACDGYKYENVGYVMFAALDAGEVDTVVQNNFYDTPAGHIILAKCSPSPVYIVTSKAVPALKTELDAAMA